MQITVLWAIHVSVFLAGNVITAIEGQAQSYPTGLRDDEDFASQGSGSGSEPPAMETPMQSSGSEPLEPATKDGGDVQRMEVATTPSLIYTTPTTPSSTTPTKRPTTPSTSTSTTTTTTPVRTSPTSAPSYFVVTGVEKQTTTGITSQLDDSCLPVSYIPSYPWPVKIYCNRESNSLRAVCLVGPPPQTCYCVDPVGGSILYDVVYPNCGPVTRTTPISPLQPNPSTTTPRAKPAAKTSPTVRVPSTTPRPTQRTTSTRPVQPTLQTTTFETSKIDQEILDARADTTKSWDQGVPVIATFMGQPGLLAAIICGAVVGLLTAVLLVMFLVYRMRKKDEGSYVIEEPSKRVPLVQPYERTREYYA